MYPFVLFDDAVQQRAFVLTDLMATRAFFASELDDLDAYLQHGWAQGWHSAFWADYELGLSLQRLPERADGFVGQLKVFWFQHKMVIDDINTWLAEHGNNEPAGIATPTFNLDPDRYTADITQIHEAIRRGDTYQINHTMRLHTRTYGNPIRLYQRLRQNVPYAVLAHLPDGDWTLCFSPELFLRIEANGQIITEPMKGTAPILNDGLDAQRAITLQNDPKNRAENTMIVDLLRNDLGKLAEIGGVSVPEPFKVSAFGKVWQMTSTVVAQMKQGICVADLFRATFPCGSITGAPKRKSMEIIGQLETTPRGLYTGSIGFLEYAPDAYLGYTGCLNVVIRTLNLRPDANKIGEFLGNYGVGSGIVMDSNAPDEYAECGWKARFLTELRPEFALFETMRVENGEIAWLNAHLNRLASSAHALNIPFNRAEAEQVIIQALRPIPSTDVYRLKLTLHATGEYHTEYAPLAPLPTHNRVIISEQILPDHDPLRCHKTSHRTHFDHAWQMAVQQGAFDALLFNQSGWLLEGGRSSVMIQLDGQWLTPALDLAILPSIARTQAMKMDNVREAYISRTMLLSAQKIRVGNALRGWIEVELVIEN